jgi:hypothetical protein
LVPLTFILSPKGREDKLEILLLREEKVFK